MFMGWLNKLNGWQRLWLLLSGLFILIAIEDDGISLEMMGYAVLFSGSLYFAGFVINWVREGFKG
tara:strand:+ start:1135 stop:1329 length:195 start_codon:yes stop_codon:yes gene_type:complete